MSVTSSEVDTAIRRVLLGAQSYRLSDGTQVNRASLEEMRALRDQLKVEEASSSAGVYRPIGFGRPS